MGTTPSSRAATSSALGRRVPPGRPVRGEPTWAEQGEDRVALVAGQLDLDGVARPGPHQVGRRSRADGLGRVAIGAVREPREQAPVGPAAGLAPPAGAHPAAAALPGHAQRGEPVGLDDGSAEPVRAPGEAGQRGQREVQRVDPVRVPTEPVPGPGDGSGGRGGGRPGSGADHAGGSDRRRREPGQLTAPKGQFREIHGYRACDISMAERAYLRFPACPRERQRRPTWRPAKAASASYGPASAGGSTSGPKASPRRSGVMLSRMKSRPDLGHLGVQPVDRVADRDREVPGVDGELGDLPRRRYGRISLEPVPGVDQVVGVHPIAGSPALGEVRCRRRPVRLLAAHHHQEVLRRLDEMVGERADVPLAAGRRFADLLGADVIEHVSGLVERVDEHSLGFGRRRRGHASTLPLIDWSRRCPRGQLRSRSPRLRLSSEK